MNTPISKISELEMKAIECHINDYAETALQVEPQYILREWNEQKQSLFERFNHNLILEKSMSFTKNANQIENEMESEWDCMNAKAQKFWIDFTRFCSMKRGEIYSASSYGLSAESRELEYNWYRCEHLIDFNVLANNAVQEEFTIDIPKPDGSMRAYHAQKGSRPMRVLGQILKAFEFSEEENFKEFSVWHSQRLNEKKIAGKFCLSIHPLDYMTMSENTHGWTSCMSWEDGGCYRGGTVEMMNSSSVIVAYMCSDNDKMKLNCGWSSEDNKRKMLEWNSKKWRILIIANESGIYSVKSYPYFHAEMTQAAMEWVASLFKDRHFEQCEKFIPYRDWDLADGVRVNIRPRSYRMYNDFGSTDHFIMLDTKTKEEVKEKYLNCGSYVDILFTYSGASECMSCGALAYIDKSTGACFDGEGSLCCQNCYTDQEDELYECECCGAVNSPEDMIWVEDVPVCQDCFRETCFEDFFNYTYHFKEDGVDMNFLIDGKEVHMGMATYDNIEEFTVDDYTVDREVDHITLEESQFNKKGLIHYRREVQNYKIRQQLLNRGLQF